MAAEGAGSEAASSAISNRRDTASSGWPTMCDSLRSCVCLRGWTAAGLPSASFFADIRVRGTRVPHSVMLKIKIKMFCEIVLVLYCTRYFTQLKYYPGTVQYCTKKEEKNLNHLSQLKSFKECFQGTQVGWQTSAP